MESLGRAANIDPFVERLRSRGIQPTAQRVKVATLLLHVRQHLTAEQLLAALNARGARVSKATLYNTLNLFAARGLVRQLSVDGTRMWFDSNVEPHYHFQHVDSGNLSDISVQDIAFSRLPQPPEGMEVEGIELLIRLRRKSGRGVAGS
jgi:Fur family iron response transcriptional regulator